MRRYLLTGMLALAAGMFAAPALAGDGYSRYFHHQLRQRELNRQDYHDDAHYYGLTRGQHHRLHDNLDHDRYHDQLLDRQFHRNQYRHSYHGYGSSFGRGHHYYRGGHSRSGFHFGGRRFSFGIHF